MCCARIAVRGQGRRACRPARSADRGSCAAAGRERRAGRQVWQPAARPADLDRHARPAQQETARPLARRRRRCGHRGCGRPARPSGSGPGAGPPSSGPPGQPAWPAWRPGRAARPVPAQNTRPRQQARPGPPALASSAGSRTATPSWSGSAAVADEPADGQQRCQRQPAAWRRQDREPGQVRLVTVSHRSRSARSARPPSRLDRPSVARAGQGALQARPVHRAAVRHLHVQACGSSERQHPLRARRRRPASARTRTARPTMLAPASPAPLERRPTAGCPRTDSGSTRRPPGPSWSSQAGAMSQAPAVTMIRSNGAPAGSPKPPSAHRTVTRARTRPSTRLDRARGHQVGVDVDADDLALPGRRQPPSPPRCSRCRSRSPAPGGPA